MRLTWKAVPTIGGLAFAGACADAPASPLREPVPAESPTLLVDAERSALVAAGLADAELRVLPTLGDEGTALRTAVSALHGALERRDAVALSRAIGPTVAAARALVAARVDLAFELEPLANSLSQAAALLPASLQTGSDNFSFTPVGH